MNLIITGHQRSGTTLMYWVCNEHPEIYLLMEFGCFAHIGIPYPAYRKHILKIAWMKRNFEFDHGPISQTARQFRLGWLTNLLFSFRFLARVRKNSSETVSINEIQAALESLFPGHCYVGDKYPDYGFQLDKFLSTESRKTIVMYRDPRDVLASVLNKSRGKWKDAWPPQMRDVGGVMRRWIRMMELINNAGDQVLAIRYESFVREPGDGVARIAKYLKVDPGRFKTNFVNSGGIGKYRQGLTGEELDLVYSLVGDLMQKYGYIPS